MKHATIFLLTLIFIISTLHLVTSTKPILFDNRDTPKPSIAPLSKLFLYTFNPEIYSSLYSSSNFYVDFLLLDIPSFLLQLTKFGKTIQLPDYEFSFELPYWCFEGACMGFVEHSSYTDTILSDVTLNQYTSSVVDNRLSIDLSIPDITIRSPRFFRTFYNYVNDVKQEWSDFSMFLKSFDAHFSADIVSTDIGIQLRNHKFYFHMEDFRFRTENNTKFFPDGTVEGLPAFEYQMAEGLNSFYETEELRTRYENELMAWINCFLSSGRLAYHVCEDVMKNEWEFQSFVLLLQTIMLGNRVGDIAN